MANKNVDGNFLEWDGLNIIPFSPKRLDLHEESLVTCRNGDKVYPHEPAIHNNTPNLTIDISSIPCGTLLRSLECEDVQRKQLFSSEKALISKLYLLAVRCHFDFKVKKLNKSIYIAVCIKENCKWRLRAVSIKMPAGFTD